MDSEKGVNGGGSVRVNGNGSLLSGPLPPDGMYHVSDNGHGSGAMPEKVSSCASTSASASASSHDGSQASLIQAAAAAAAAAHAQGVLLPPSRRMPASTCV